MSTQKQRAQRFTYWDGSGWRGPWTITARNEKEAREIIRSEHGVKTLRGFTIYKAESVPEHCR